MYKLNWVDELSEKYGSGVAHAFIIHFNVQDYIEKAVSLRQYLSKMWAKKEIVVFYNCSSGFSFAEPEMETSFKKIAGLNSQEKKQNDTMLSALGISNSELPTNPIEALSIIEKALITPILNEDEAKVWSGIAVIIEYTESICPNADLDKMTVQDRQTLVTLQRWAKEPTFINSGNPIILVASSLSDLHDNIKAASSKWEAIEIPIPNYESRLRFINWYLESRNGFENEFTPEQLACITAGLSLVHIEDIFLRAMQCKKLSQQLVSERKEDIIRSEFGEVIEVLEPSYSYDDIGGLDYIKDFFIKSIIRPMREGRHKRVPMGVLLTGPAGTGKTIMAEAVSYESGVNCVILNSARLFGRYVGDTERSLDKALKAIEALSPTIVFIDEIDQMVSRGTGGDSGVSNRFFKRLLEFMGDGTHRGNIVILAATNRPDLMDAALKRPGRFDKKVPFLLPDDRERIGIFLVMCGKYGLEIENPNHFPIAETDGYTGAEIEALVIKAIEVVEDYGKPPVEALRHAVEAISPTTADIELMTNLAIAECNDRDLLPDRYKNRLDDRKELSQQIAGQKMAMRGAREV